MRVTIAVIKHHDEKQVGEKWVYFVYTSISQFITEGSQGRNSCRVGSWRQELEECCSLAWSLWFAQLAFVQNSGPAAQSGTTYSGRGLLPSISN